MSTYTFRYFNADGGLIRVAAMQCASDNESILQACKTMSEPFSSLEILLDDVEIFKGPRTFKSDVPDILRVA
jgi:hypothetical protein